MTATRRDLRAGAQRRLREGAVPTPELDADVLLAHVLGVSKEEVYARPESPVRDDEAARFAAMVERRAAGEPVAYLRGWKEFYGLRFGVDPRVLIPRPETELIVDLLRERVARGARVVADIGTGSGAIAVALAVNESSVRVIATDISADALAVAAANASAHGVSERVDLRIGDLFAPVSERVDAVAANLPYLRADALADLSGDRTSLAFEPRTAVVAGDDGLVLIRRALGDLRRVLAPGGAAFFECDPPQARAIAEIAAASFADIAAAPFAVRTLRDLAGAERVLAVEPMS